MTGSGDWRSRRWESTHQRIYDVALALFEEHGFDQVSIGQIAAGAGVSVPTFYAHYPSKEHLVMQLPSGDDVAALLSTQPADLPIGQRMRHAVSSFFAQWDMTAQLARWRIIATTPSLRRRAAEFERATAALVVDALPRPSGAPAGPSDAIVINAYLAAFTAGVLVWADSDGEKEIGAAVEEAFEALEALRRR
ncbi:TetR/AcrR family transcriptional regulator [Blastococcus sp. PRF04-17]|uniref:TetR/AcrR family transcriptional regulator n=1 Tax=Blastococcus sp. PRF04-17 TaxID=2933797 RepID=UPI001FF1896B|nr:TetR/AcrR family transcriptional regulator [Blastococcus sp. PRF04-17]UOY00508.1 TetR/AcrR family transcriptional regulator [Blastococcus sp. PRF04-17]